MVKRLVLGSCLLAVFATSVPAHAGSLIGTRYYEAGAPFVAAKRTDPTCSGRARPCTLSADGQIDVGRVIFGKLGGRSRYRSVRVRVYDDVNPLGAVRFQLCQDNNGNGNCGTDRGEVSYDNCSPGAPSMKVSTKYPIEIWILSAWGCPTYLVPDAADRPAMATSGKVRLYYL
jgi:hypothetical protein